MGEMWFEAVHLDLRALDLMISSVEANISILWPKHECLLSLY